MFLTLNKTLHIIILAVMIQSSVHMVKTAKVVHPCAEGKLGGKAPRAARLKPPTCAVPTHVSNIQPVNHIAQLHNIFKIALK